MRGQHLRGHRLARAGRPGEQHRDTEPAVHPIGETPLAVDLRSLADLIGDGVQQGGLGLRQDDVVPGGARDETLSQGIEPRPGNAAGGVPQPLVQPNCASLGLLAWTCSRRVSSTMVSAFRLNWAAIGSRQISGIGSQRPAPDVRLLSRGRLLDIHSHRRAVGVWPELAGGEQDRALDAGDQAVDRRPPGRRPCRRRQGRGPEAAAAPRAATAARRGRDQRGRSAAGPGPAEEAEDQASRRCAPRRCAC